MSTSESLQIATRYRNQRRLLAAGKWVGAATFLAASVWVVQWSQELAKVDPFAGLRPRQIPGLREEVGIKLEDVEFSYYRNGKLSTKADVDKFEIIRDRITYEMSGVRNGVIAQKSPETGPIQFAAATALWRTDTKSLEVRGQTRIAGKDFDFKTNGLTIDEAKQLVRMPKPVSGRLKGGIARAESGSVNLNTEAFSGKNIRFIGQLPGIDQDPDAPKEAKRTAWDVQSDTMDDSGKETRIMTYVDASATDGEVLIKAPKILLDRKTDVLTASGRVFYYSGKANIVADSVVVNRKEKRAVFSGNVVMLVKKKDEETTYKPQEEELPPFKPLVPDEVKVNRPEDTFGPSQAEKDLDKKLRDGETLREYPLTLLAKNIDYVYRKGSRLAKITGDPQGRQNLPDNRWRQVWTYEAEYNGETEILKTFSRDGKFESRMKNSIGDDLVARIFTVHTKEGDERFSAEKIKGKVYSDPDDDLPRDEKKKTTGTTGGG
jgi:hypothetical protein